MKRIFIILVAVLMFASCAVSEEPKTENPEVQSGESDILESEPEPENPVPEPENPVPEPEQEEETEPWYVKLSDVEIPEFPEADTAKLPTDRNNLWNTDGQGFFIDFAIKQYFCDHDEAMEIAEKIYLAEGYHISGYHDREFFEDVSEADNDYLLYSALRLAPFIEFGVMSYNNQPEGADHPENVVVKALEYFYGETGMQVVDAYYADDVEYIFHYLFGTKAEYNPEDLELYGYPYVPSAGIFLNFFDSTPPAAVPQILSIVEKDGKYYAEVVWTDVFSYVKEDYVPEELVEGPNVSKILVLADETEKETFPEAGRIIYILEKENGYGRFYISGISE